MRGIQVAASVSRSTNLNGSFASRIEEDFLLYSAMRHKQLATIGLDDNVELYYYSPYWAVMLAGRDTAQMVNMIPHMEEYKWLHPLAKNHGQLQHGAVLTLKLPFLTNKRDLAPGDLFVLPFDGGMSEMICEAFPPMPSKVVRFPRMPCEAFRRR